MKFIRPVMILSCVVVDISTFACDVCKKQQPKILSGIAHGTGAESTWDYLWVCGIAAIAVASLIYAVRCIVRPGENEQSHIKRSILNRE